jgi:hypothetical protein
MALAFKQKTYKWRFLSSGVQWALLTTGFKFVLLLELEAVGNMLLRKVAVDYMALQVVEQSV